MKLRIPFWSRVCVFCHTVNIVLLNDIYIEGRETDLAFLPFNIAETKGDVADFVKQKGLIFPGADGQGCQRHKEKVWSIRCPNSVYHGQKRYDQGQGLRLFERTGALGFCESEFKEKRLRYQRNHGRLFIC